MEHWHYTISPSGKEPSGLIKKRRGWDLNPRGPKTIGLASRRLTWMPNTFIGVSRQPRHPTNCEQSRRLITFPKRVMPEIPSFEQKLEFRCMPILDQRSKYEGVYSKKQGHLTSRAWPRVLSDSWFAHWVQDLGEVIWLTSCLFASWYALAS